MVRPIPGLLMIAAAVALFAALRVSWEAVALYHGAAFLALCAIAVDRVRVHGAGSADDA